MAKNCTTCGGKKRLSWAERQFTTQRQRPGDIHRHLSTLKDLTVATSKEMGEPLTIIELGVRQAVSTSAWLFGLEQSPHKGHIYGVDLADPPSAIVSHERLTFVKGDDIADETLSQLPDRAHIVFIDSSHEYDHTVREIATYADRLVPGGAMVFHDTAVMRFPHHTSRQPPFPVSLAVSEWIETLRGEGRDPVVKEWTKNNGLMIVWP